MPNPADILSLQEDADPDDLLRMQLGQNQGANLAGGPQPPGTPTGMPTQLGAPGPSPNVPGPLAALAPPAPAKPKVKIRLLPKGKKPKIKLKTKSKPKISYADFLRSIGG